MILGAQLAFVSIPDESRFPESLRIKIRRLLPGLELMTKNLDDLCSSGSSVRYPELMLAALVFSIFDIIAEHPSLERLEIQLDSVLRKYASEPINTLLGFSFNTVDYLPAAFT